MKRAFTGAILSIGFVFFFTLLFSNTISAQDNIIMRNNDVIKAKVTEVDVNTVKYQRFDNLDGPAYVANKSDIYMIIYANGTKDVMNDINQDTTQQNTVNQQNTQGRQTNTSQDNYTAQPANTNQQNNSNQQQYNSQQQNYPSDQDNMPAPNDAAPAQQQGDDISMQTFYNELSPYGNWVNTPSYGYVWVPSVGMDFTPYATAGHWVFTDYGWTWVSDFPWGWAAFHYGRWYYDPYMGYAWIPNTMWGPAWVNWRSSQGYYGWAPMGPEGYEYPRERWAFVSAGYITSDRVYEHYEPRSNVTVIYNNTTVVVNHNSGTAQANYSSGPSRTEVEHVTHTAIAPVKIVSSRIPGQTVHNGAELSMYHPAVHAGNAAAPAKPTNVVTPAQVTPPAQRTTVVHPPVRNGYITATQPVNNHVGVTNSNVDNSMPGQHPAPARLEQHPAQPEHPALQEQRPAQQQQEERPAQTQQPSRPAQQKQQQQSKPAQRPAARPAPKQNNPKPNNNEHH